MRIQITQPNLQKALALLSRVASTKAALPILANILLKAESGTLELAATNLEVAISHKAQGKIDKAGSVTVPARLLHDFVSQLPKDSTISLVFEKNKLFVSTGSYKSHMQGAPAEDFPALPSIKTGATIKVDKEQLKQALNRTTLAVSHDETRPVLGGVYFHTSDNNLFMAATDGYRLAEARLIETSESLGCVVPLQTLQDIQRIIQDSNEEDDLVLQFEDGQLGVVCGATSLVSRLIDGEYPQYQQLIPDTSEVSVTLDREELLTAAKLAGLFAKETGGSITLSASEVDGSFTVSSVASQVGDNTSTIKAEVTGNGEVVVNVRYLTDALNCFETNQVTFRFSGSISPCVLTAADQPGYQHIVMPLKS